MKEKYTITINPKQINKKPDKTLMSSHTSGLNTITAVTINEFSTLVSTPNSCSWFGGTFKEKLENVNVESINLIAFDFDEGNDTPENKISIFRDFGIMANMWYSTFSSTAEKPKYRIVLFLEYPILNMHDHELIYNGVLHLIKDADSSCKNPSRFFFGGKYSKIIHEKPIALSSLVDAINIGLISSDNGRTRKIFSLSNNSISGNNGSFLYNNNRSTQFLPDYININTNTTSITGGVTSNWDIARKRVKILDKFLSGEWLYHNQLFGLATNMVQIRGGQSLFQETMNKFNESGQTRYTQNNFSIITYLKKVNYKPQHIYKFSPYEEDATLHDIISEVVDRRGKIEIIKPQVFIPLALAEKKFKADFEEILSKKDDSGIYLIKVPPGIGKTELLTSVNATLAFPTHSLKNEVSERMKIQYFVSPDSIHFSDNRLNNKLYYYYSTGKYQTATALIHAVAKNTSSKFSKDDQSNAAKYLREIKISKKTKDTVLTTHSRAMILDHSHDTIIFDEDFLDTLLSVKKVTLTDLTKILLSSEKDFDKINNYIEVFRKAEPGVPHFSPKLKSEIDSFFETLNKTIITGNIIDLITSQYFIKDTKDLDTIYYLKLGLLPSNKKIIVMSATASEMIYSKIFGEKLKILKIDNVESQGKINQYTNKSCSRHALNRYCETISDKVDNQPVITFKEFSKFFKNPVENMYFGNTSGYDELKGKDITVVGTPHRNNVLYYLIYAQIHGIEENFNTKMIYQKIEYNGFRFKFNCYENEILREIQLSIIEGDLIQACGRARILRTDATVTLFSNFPLRSVSNFLH